MEAADVDQDVAPGAEDVPRAAVAEEEARAEGEAEFVVVNVLHGGAGAAERLAAEAACVGQPLEAVPEDRGVLGVSLEELIGPLEAVVDADGVGEGAGEEAPLGADAE